MRKTFFQCGWNILCVGEIQCLNPTLSLIETVCSLFQIKRGERSMCPSLLYHYISVMCVHVSAGLRAGISGSLSSSSVITRLLVNADPFSCDPDNMWVCLHCRSSAAVRAAASAVRLPAGLQTSFWPDVKFSMVLNGSSKVLNVTVVSAEVGLCSVCGGFKSVEDWCVKNFELKIFTDLHWNTVA